ncbi:MAG: MATE family efflux transporter [Clostridia bacterium]|nr:MATE family efflux transporter [Clostridia bacterium]
MRELFKDKVFLRNITGLALPIMLNELINSLINIMDTFMTGKLGAESVTAVGLSNQIFFLFNLCCFGICSGATIFMAQYWGSRDIKGVRRVLGMAAMLVECCAVIFFIGARLFPREILSIYSKDIDVIDLGESYITIVSFSYLIMAFVNVVNVSLKAIGKAAQPMITTFIALITNVILNYIFIFEMGLGVKGAALGTIGARSLELIVQLTLVFGRKLPIVGNIKDYFVIDRSFIKKYLAVAFPVFLNEFFWALGTTGYNVAYKYSGTIAQAAVQVSSSVQNLFAVAGMGVGAACGIILSNALGAKDRERAIDYSKKGKKLSILFSIVSGSILALSAPLIVSFFDIHDLGRKYALYMLYVVAVGIIVKNINYINIVGILRSGGDTLAGLILDMASVWFIGIPMAFLGSMILGLPIYITFTMVYFEEVIKMIFSEARVLKLKWANTII